MTGIGNRFLIGPFRSMIYQAWYREGGRLFSTTKNEFFVFKGKQNAEIIFIGAIGDVFNEIANKNLLTAFQKTEDNNKTDQHGYGSSKKIMARGHTSHYPETQSFTNITYMRKCI